MSTSSFNAAYALGSIAETLLAAPGSMTCVVDGDESLLSQCVAHILQNIDIQHPVGHVINSALQCHHDNYHCGTKTLLVMTCMWLRELECLVQQGVPLDAVLREFHQAIEQCVQQLQCIKTAVEDVVKNLKPTHTSCTGEHDSRSMLDDSSDDTLQSHISGRMPNCRPGCTLLSNSCGRKLDDSSGDLQDRKLDDSSGDLQDRKLDDSSGDLQDRKLGDSSRDLQGRKLDDSSGDLQDRKLDDSSGDLQDRKLDDSSGDLQDRKLDDSSGDLQHRKLDDTSGDLQDRKLDDSSGDLQDRKLDDSSGDLQDIQTCDKQRLAVASTVASKNVTSAIVPQDPGDMDDLDDISWYFEGSSCYSPHDDALGMLMDAVGDMQEELGGFTYVGPTSCMARSCDLSHDSSHTPSGDMVSAVSNGMTLLSGKDSEATHDSLSSCQEKTECQENSAGSSSELLRSDKEAQIASILEQLTQTSQLLVRCTQTMASADVRHSDSDKGCNGHKVESNTGSNTNSNKCSNTGSNMGSTTGSNIDSNTGFNIDGMSHSDTATHTPTHLSDSDDEFSSCFDGVVDHVKCSKQLEGTPAPPSGQHVKCVSVSQAGSHEDVSVLAGKITAVNEACILNGSQHFSTFQSMRCADATQDSCDGVTDEMMHLKSSCHLQKINKNKASSEAKTSQVSSEVKTSQVSSEAKTSQVSSEVKTSQVSSEAKTLQVSSEVKTSQVSSEAKTSQVSSEAKTSQVSSEAKTSQVSPEAKTSQVSSEAKTSQASSEAKTLQVSPEVKTSQVSSEAKTSQVSSEAKTSQVSSEAKTSQVSSEVKTSQVSSEAKTSQVSSEAKTSQVSPQSQGRCSQAYLEDTSWADTTPERQQAHAGSTHTVLLENDLQETVSRFIHCCHQGCDDVLEVLTEAVLRQLKCGPVTDRGNHLRFDVSRVHTVTVVGPMRCDVTDGLVVETDVHQLSLLSEDSRPLLLVHGDVSSGFHHKGFNEKTKTCVVSKTLLSDSRDVSWLNDISVVLTELRIGAVLVHGNVSEEVREMCNARGIVILDHVPYKVLLGVAESCLCEPTIYLSDATQDNVADDVIIRPWSCDWMDHLLTSVSFALVQPNRTLVQTVLVSHPCESVTLMKEETFWHCAHQLHNMLVDGAVLPGGGTTEQACADMLQSSKICGGGQVEASNAWSGLVSQHVAQGLEHFAQLVQRNSSLLATDQSHDTAGHIEGATIYDCLRAKQDAWRTAEYLVGALMAADTEVVTGVDKNYVRAQGDVIGHV